MPLIVKWEDNHSQFALWKISEKADYFQNAIPISDKQWKFLENLSQKRKLEWLVSRYTFAQLTGGVQCFYEKTDLGKPFFLDSPLYPTISHSEKMIAVGISPYALGIDIQVKAEKILKIIPKFVNKHEHSMLNIWGDKLDIAHYIWSIKESMFKAWGKGGIDFKKNLLIENIEWDGKKGSGNSILTKENMTIHFDVRLYWYESYYMAYVLENYRQIY